MTAWNALPKAKKRLLYAAAFAVILGAEIIIGLYGRGFVRSSLGDILAVVGVYCAARVVLVAKPKLLSVRVTLFAFAVELVQLTRLSAFLGEGTLLGIIAGATFDPLDLLCYLIGGAACAAWDIISGKN